MAFKMAVARAAATIDTPPYTQDFTNTDLGGDTPDAALFFITRATSDGTPVDHAIVGMGSATATDARWAWSTSSEHNVTSGDRFRRGTADECIMILDPAAGAVDGEADFTSFISNGVRVTWGDAPASAYLVIVVLFAGLDNAYAGNFTASATQDAYVDVTDGGFRPGALVFGWPMTAADDTTANAWECEVGFAANSSPVTQASRTFIKQDGTDNNDDRAILWDHYGIAAMVIASPYYKYAVEISFEPSNGFRATTRLAADGSGDDIGYLALGLPSGCSAKVQTHTTKTSSGTQDYTGYGFDPLGILCLFSMLDTVDTAFVDDIDTGSWCFGAATGADDEYSVSVCDQTNVTDSNTQSLSDDVICNMPLDDGSTGIVANFDSWITDGWRANFTQYDATARHFITLAFSPSEIAFTERGVGRGVARGVLRGI